MTDRTREELTTMANEIITAWDKRYTQDTVKMAALILARGYIAAPPAPEPVAEWRSSNACKVCGNIPDEDGNLEHGRGCYTQSEDGGGTSFVEPVVETNSRHESVYAKLLAACERVITLIDNGLIIAKPVYHGEDSITSDVIGEAKEAIAAAHAQAEDDAKRNIRCLNCGLQMSRNPHPDAGKVSSLMTVGATWECIPCTYNRAVTRGHKLRDLERQDADDAKPVDEAWLQSIGFKDDGPSMHLGPVTHYPVQKTWMVFGYRVEKRPTRGDVRRLLAALGVKTENGVNSIKN